MSVKQGGATPYEYHFYISSKQSRAFIKQNESENCNSTYIFKPYRATRSIKSAVKTLCKVPMLNKSTPHILHFIPIIAGGCKNCSKTQHFKAEASLQLFVK
jgi:hypothetical protein